MSFVIFNTFNIINAQSINVKQDEKFEQLLAEKRKINASITNNNRFKIQIFNGTNEIAKKELITFKRENKNYDATIIFNTPTYKVIVGNFKTRIEAEKSLTIIKKKYPNAILIKPNK
ncbi:SPOR domain-containing protein [Flavobacterium sp.]|uniref:SPOR domain-containing protein n=1 Tax=Flavobacterium sp. TaxID=239 RepID=UPI002627DB54|nr:SPOR domain-containing protein [Flavobacterium sp.]